MTLDKALALTLVVGSVVGCAQPPPSYTPSVSASSYTSPAPRRWGTACRTDRFRDVETCQVKLNVETARPPIVVASLATDDAGQTWTIVASPPPVVYQLRVDRNDAIVGACRGPAGICQVQNPAALTAQLRGGSTLAMQITTVRGTLDRDFPVDGAAAALDEAERRAPRPAQSPARGARRPAAR